MEYYTLAELSNETGVPARNIRYWIEQGLVPKGVNANVPTGKKRAGRWGVYTYDHVRRVLAVRDLADQNRSVADMRDFFNPLFGDRP